MLAVDKNVLDAKSRLAHVALLNLNLRMMENWRAAQKHSARGMLDYDSLMILMAVIVISADKVLRCGTEPERLALENTVTADMVGRSNLSSLAAATGINRETVRRKVNKLQEAGWLSRDDHGIHIVGGAMPLDVIRDVIGTQLEAITGTVNRLKRSGVLSATERHVENS